MVAKLKSYKGATEYYELKDAIYKRPDIEQFIIRLFFVWMNLPVISQTAYHGCGGCGLVHLVLSRLDLSLQMGWWVKVLALFSGASTLDVVHAHGDRVVVGVDHGAVSGVGEATVVLTAGAVSPLILPTHLESDEEKET